MYYVLYNYYEVKQKKIITCHMILETHINIFGNNISESELSEL